MGGQPPSRVRIPPSPLPERPASPWSWRRVLWGVFALWGLVEALMEAIWKHSAARPAVDVPPGRRPVGRLCLPSYVAEERSRSRLSRDAVPTPSEGSGLTAGGGEARWGF